MKTNQESNEKTAGVEASIGVNIVGAKVILQKKDGNVSTITTSETDERQIRRERILLDLDDTHAINDLHDLMDRLSEVPIALHYDLVEQARGRLDLIKDETWLRELTKQISMIGNSCLVKLILSPIIPLWKLITWLLRLVGDMIFSAIKYLPLPKKGFGKKKIRVFFIIDGFRSKDEALYDKAFYQLEALSTNLNSLYLVFI